MPDLNDLNAVKAACAGVLAVDKSMALLGSAYLIRPRLAATAAHVVLRPRTRKPREGVMLAFTDGECRRASVTNVNLEADCALLELAEAVEGVSPLSLDASPCAPDERWWSYGFPQLLKRNMMQIDGLIKDPEIRNDNQSALLVSVDNHQVTSKNTRGFSGSPLVLKGKRVVVGHLKRMLAPDAPGYDKLLACPAQSVIDLLPAEARSGLRPQVQALLPPGAAYQRTWYINRAREELTALRNLDVPGAPVILCAPEKLGKSWLLDYLLEQQRESAGKDRFVELDLIESGLPDQPTPGVALDPFLRDLAEQVASKLGLNRDSLAAAWDGWGTAGRKLKRWLESEALASIAPPGRLFLALENADAVWRAGLGNQFFPLLKAWSEGSKDKASPWTRLRLILSVSTAPALLVPDTSPLNVSEPIHLEDLSREQVAQLASLYGLRLEAGELDELMRLIGGHTYLVSLVMSRVALLGHRLDRVLQEVLNNCGDYCRSLQLVTNEPKLRAALCDLLHDPKAAADPVQAQRLKDAGLMVRSHGGIVPRFGLYHSYFRHLCKMAPAGAS
jgi:hypothetical protein